MGKLLTAITLLVALEFALALFVSCVPQEGVACEGKTSLFLFILNPQLWSAQVFVSWLKDNLLLLAGAGVIIAGLTIFTKIEFPIYLGLAAVFYSYGQVIYTFWQHLTAGGSTFFAGASALFASIFIGGILIYFTFAVIDFARGRD